MYWMQSANLQHEENKETHLAREWYDEVDAGRCSATEVRASTFMGVRRWLAALDDTGLWTGVLGVVKEGREICDLKDCAEDPLVVEAEEVRLLTFSSWFCRSLGETCNKSSNFSWWMSGTETALWSLLTALSGLRRPLMGLFALWFLPYAPLLGLCKAFDGTGSFGFVLSKSSLTFLLNTWLPILDPLVLDSLERDEYCTDCSITYLAYWWRRGSMIPVMDDQSLSNSIMRTCSFNTSGSLDPLQTLLLLASRFGLTFSFVWLALLQVTRGSKW